MKTRRHAAQFRIVIRAAHALRMKKSAARQTRAVRSVSAKPTAASTMAIAPFPARRARTAAATLRRPATRLKIATIRWRSASATSACPFAMPWNAPASVPATTILAIQCASPCRAIAISPAPTVVPPTGSALTTGYVARRIAIRHAALARRSGRRQLARGLPVSQQMRRTAAARAPSDLVTAGGTRASAAKARARIGSCAASKPRASTPHTPIAIAD